ncbi:MAG: AbrB family transcriptional regulator [Thermodesulfobacteriota bacterium]
MDAWRGLAVYLVVGAVGGLIGLRLKVPGGPLVGAMMAVILLRAFVDKPWSVPRGYSHFVQILIGVMVGVGYSQEIAQAFGRLVLPIIASTLILMAVGLLTSLLLAKINVLDASTAYLSTSPGALNAMIGLAEESGANATMVLAFHFFRLVFIILTAPLVFQLIRFFSNRAGG